jgi:LAO/AO transport system kinase
VGDSAGRGAAAGDRDQEVAELRDAVRAGDRRALARLITRIESTRDDDAELGQRVLEELVPHTGGAIRVGVTGPPGVGKSTFIEALGLHLIERGHRVAVLAVDPSSPVSRGSILGDKTRMEELARHERAFVRPSPSGGSLGGVAHRTRECLLVCEAAGYDVVLIETVGIGQSEVAVASMVDFFLVLLLPAGGDELQGIKKGVMELADALVVNKADGDTLPAAERTRIEYEGALGLIRAASPSWKPVALAASALEGTGVAQVWQAVLDHRARLGETGELERRRRDQNRAWMWSLLDEALRQSFRADPAVAAAIPGLERDVERQRTTPAAAARQLLAAFRRPPTPAD